MGKETCNLQPGYYGTSCDFQDIKNAVTLLSNKSEAQFEEIKNEKWYKRLFNIVTCSKKNNIRMAEQITSLAQAQEILVEILVRLADEDNQIAKLVMQSQNDIYQLAQASEYLQDRLYLLEDKCLGIKEYENLKGLDQQQRMILSACLHQACSLYEEPSEEQRFYANEVLTYLGTEASVDNLEEALDAMDDAAKRKIFSCIITYMYLYDHTEATLEQEPRQNFIDLFDLGRKTVKSIKQQVVDIHRLRGVNGCVGRCLITPEDITESTPFEVEIENAEDNEDTTTDESNYSEDWEIDTSIEREYLKISGIIPVTAKKVYENKDIHFSSAIIECSGELEFRNCTIHYNEDSASHIYLRNQASLMILSSTVICHGCWKESQSFIIAGTNAVCVMAGVCFLDCVDFISGNFEVFRFEKNICFDCCKNFLDISIHKQGEAKIDDNVFLFLCEPFFKPISSTEGTWPKGKCIDFHGSGKKLLSNCGVKCFSNQKSCYMDSIIFVDFRPSRYSENGNNDVCYCSFSNVKNCIHGGTQIYNCIFDHCQKVIYSCPAACSILNCQFVDCEHAICDMDQGGIIQNCQFSGSTKEGYISSNKGCPIKIISCEFANLSLAKENSLNNRGIILLGACSDKEISINGTTQISCCIFNGVKLTGWNTFSSYLITHSYSQPRVKQPIAYVSDCIFQNCVTDDLNGEIIKQKGTHYGRFNRVSHFPEISVYNCSGYDEVKDLNHSISPIALEMRETDSDGNKIGSGYILNHSYEEYLEVKTSYLNQERT